MNPEELFEAVRNKVAQILKDGEGCHDFDHTLRVLKNASLLAEEEKLSPADYEAVKLAALLHDCARPEEFESGGKVCHAALGARKSTEILRELECTDEILVQTISDAVARHRFRGKILPVTIVDKILFDADKLDSIGAAGIGRAFLFAGRIGARLHNSEQEALQSEPYSRNDTAYREYLVKLRHVPGRMLTVSGRRHAVARAEFMDQFFRELRNETEIE